MKKTYLQILFSILFITGFIFNSSLADEKIRLILKQPPPNKLGAGDLWKLDITNTTGGNINIYLTGTATASKKGLIVSGKSKVLTVSPGKKTYTYEDFKSGEVNWKDKSIQEIILRTGNVPEDNYIICVTAFYEGGEVADQESCIEQSVKLEGSITLISPEDRVELNAIGIDVIVVWPVFAWTGTGLNGQYDLVIVEIKGQQSQDEAIKENRHFYDKKGITTTSFQYQITGPKFEKGKKYAWQISSGDVNSEVNTFTIKKNNFEQITLLYPYDDGEVGIDTLTFTWNRNEPCPPRVLCNYSLRIVELKGSQSPDDAIKENEPLFEKKDINETSFQHRFGIDKPGVKIAWQITSSDGGKSGINTLRVKEKGNRTKSVSYSVELIQNNNTVAKTTIDSSGNFILKNIPEGQYGLKISNPNGETHGQFLITFDGFSKIICCCPGPPCEDPVLLIFGQITEIKNKAFYFKNNEIKAKLCPCKDCCPPPMMNVNDK